MSNKPIEEAPTEETASVGTIPQDKAVSNRIFCEQMARALVDLGTEETLSCMGRMMCAIASDQGVELEFDCDLGTVSIKPKPIPSTH